MPVSHSPLSAVSYGYLDDLQQRFAHDPASVEPGWRVLFSVLDEVARRTGDGAVQPLLLAALRARGHLRADLDPLTPAPPPSRAALVAELPQDHALAWERLCAAWCGTLTAETAHFEDAALAHALQAAIEHRPAEPARDDRRTALRHLIAAEEFEAFLARKHPTKKRFGAEGAEAICVLLLRALRQAAAAGVTHAVFGAMHRGRHNLLGTVLGKPLVQLLAEIGGAHPFAAAPPRVADVPYHLGAETTLAFAEGTITAILMPNPSHLEAVGPVALGHARALQDRLGPSGVARVLPIVLHTDAAVTGQGVVAECVQLAATAGFATGGTLHIVLNNQIGFTTEAAELRSSRHCTAPWKMTDSAILHVNGDDPDAVLEAADIALDWRGTQQRDAVIDLVCYRRNGHNEIDDPSFTQPLRQRTIAARPSVRALYEARLLADGAVTSAEARQWADSRLQELEAAYAAAPQWRSNRSGFAPRAPAAAVVTGVPDLQLRELAQALTRAPAGFHLHPRLARVLEQRATEIGGAVAFPLAEALAFAATLTDGVPVRLTGQDVVRGAFVHRHFAAVDTETGVQHVFLRHLAPGQARFDVFNSPLSEYAVLGFEYGYSLGRPEALVIWEAQFGDFANGAQIVIDHFIAPAEEKWCAASNLVMLLPHGLEGQGPEHASARPERFLQLAARDNFRLVCPSTPASYFHVLRGQALAKPGKPLIVLGPKKLLRLPAALSPWSDFAPDRRFEPVICSLQDEPPLRVLLCAGKIAYDLEQARERLTARHVAIVRLEQLYPFPAHHLTTRLARWQPAEVRWVQEEAENQGPWPWLESRLRAVMAASGRADAVRCCARPESASAAASFHEVHERDQQAVIDAAFA